MFLPFSFGPFIGFWAAVEGAKYIGALMIPGGGRDSMQRLQMMRELVITNLGRIGYPVIRYRSGDLVRLDLVPCACGRTFVRFDGGVLGRADDMVVVRGVNVFPRAIENLIRQFDAIDEFRVTVATRHEMRELNVEIEVADGTHADAIRASVEQSIHYTLSLRPIVTVAERGSLPRYELKARRFHVEN